MQVLSKAVVLALAPSIARAMYLLLPNHMSMGLATALSTVEHRSGFLDSPAPCALDWTLSFSTRRRPEA